MTKTMNNKLIPVAFVLLSVLSVIAQTNTNSIPAPSVPGVKGEGTSLLLAIIPLLVPIIVAAAKTGLKWLPVWFLPILAAGLGELLNFLSGLAGGPSTTVINGVIFGAAGTGAREVLDQIKQKIASGKETTP